MSRSRVGETKFDLDLLLRELQQARIELLAVPEDAIGFDLQRAMCEPLARVEMMRRTLQEVLDRFRWKPHAAERDAIGPSRPLDGTRRKAIVHRTMRARRVNG